MELPDHDCPLRPIVLAQQKIIDEELPALRAKLEAALVLIAKLERALYGKKSEKMPPVAEALRAEETAEQKEARREAALERRMEREALKRKLASQTVIQHVV